MVSFCASSARAQQDADAEVVAVEHHVDQHRQAHHHQEDQRQPARPASRPPRVSARSRSGPAAISASAARWRAQVEQDRDVGDDQRAHTARGTSRALSADRCRGHRRGRVGGGQHAGHQPRLAADLGHVPAGQGGDPAGRRSSRPAPAAASAAVRRSPRSCHAPSHDTSSISMPMPTITRKAKNTGATGGCRPSNWSSPATSPSGSWRRIRLAPLGDGDLEAVAARVRVGHGEQHQRRAALGLPDRLHRGDLGRLVLERVEPVQVAERGSAAGSARPPGARRAQRQRGHRPAVSPRSQR